MSSQFSYDISIDPSPAPIDVTVSIDNTDVKATIASVPSLKFSLTPTGNLIQKIASAIAWPIATLIAGVVKDKPKDALQGQSKSVGSIPGYSTNGNSIVPRKAVLGSATSGGTPMLQVTASLTVTKAS